MYNYEEDYTKLLDVGYHNDMHLQSDKLHYG